VTRITSTGGDSPQVQWQIGHDLVEFQSQRYSPDGRSGFIAFTGLPEVEAFSMNDFFEYLSLFIFALLLILYAAFLAKVTPQNHRNSTRLLARVGVFGALSAILYIVPIFQIKLFFLPSFLELHFDEIPAFIAGFAYGPIAGTMVILIKTILKLPFTSSLTVGEWSDFLFSLVFVVPASFLYQKKRTLKGAVLAISFSSLLQLMVSAILNVYLVLPFYMNVMGLPYENLLALCKIANPNVMDLGWTYGLYCVIPLNLIKDAIVLVITFFIYRHIHVLLHLQNPSNS